MQSLSNESSKHTNMKPKKPKNNSKYPKYAFIYDIVSGSKFEFVEKEETKPDLGLFRILGKNVSNCAVQYACVFDIGTGYVTILLPHFLWGSLLRGTFLEVQGLVSITVVVNPSQEFLSNFRNYMSANINKLNNLVDALTEHYVKEVS